MAQPCYPNEVSADRVDLWCCGAATDACADDLISRLSPDEQERAARYRFDADRRRFVSSRFLLRSALAHYLSRPPQTLRFSAGEWGKPSLPAAGSDLPGLSFSLSRSHQVALLAVGTGPEIGVDVEFCRPERADAAIVARQFSNPEQLYVARAPDRVAAFFEVWARKEAYIKALGRGLSHPLRGFDTTPHTGDDWTAVRDERCNEVGSDWMVRNVTSPVENYAMALAARRPAPRLELVSVTLPELAMAADPWSAP